MCDDFSFSQCRWLSRTRDNILRWKSVVGGGCRTFSADMNVEEGGVYSLLLVGAQREGRQFQKARSDASRVSSGLSHLIGHF